MCRGSKRGGEPTGSPPRLCSGGNDCTLHCAAEGQQPKREDEGGGYGDQQGEQAAKRALWHGGYLTGAVSPTIAPHITRLSVAGYTRCVEFATEVALYLSGL